MQILARARFREKFIVLVVDCISDRFTSRGKAPKKDWSSFVFSFQKLFSLCETIVFL
jgi:hypothetical protein